jgi:uncharacterized protein (DUF1778 family)
MSTTKPRVTITLEPDVHRLLQRASEAKGESMSSIITSFLDVAIPPIERMVDLLEQAKAMPEVTRRNLANSLTTAEAQVMPLLLEAIERAERQGQRRAERRRRATLTPVPVTRGSGLQDKGKKAVRRGRV